MDAISLALEDLKSLKPGEKPNYTQTAKKYGVNRTTLSKRYRGVQGSFEKQYENQRILNNAQAAQLIKWIKDLTERGQPPSNEMLRNFAKEITGKKPGKTWPSRFQARYGMSAKQEREATQTLSSNLPPPRASGYQRQETGLATDGIEQPQDEPLGKPANSSPCKPKCALYFSSLIKAHWDDFGATSSGSESPNITRDMFSFLITFEAQCVYNTLVDRLSLIKLGKQYTKIVKDGMSEGMTVENARIFASRKMIFEAGKKEEVTGENEGLRSDEFIQHFDKLISLALGWQALLDAIGAPEVLLIHFEKGDALDWDDDIPVPRIGLHSDDESTCPLPELLSPRLGLKETCLRLSGVADMIKRLKELDHSELRTFLAGEIKRRVQGVFGDPSAYFGQESDSEEDLDSDDADNESMADAESTPNNDDTDEFNCQNDVSLC